MEIMGDIQVSKQRNLVPFWSYLMVPCRMIWYRTCRKPMPFLRSTWIHHASRMSWILMFRWALGAVNYIWVTGEIIGEVSQPDVHHVVLVLEVQVYRNNEFLLRVFMPLITWGTNIHLAVTGHLSSTFCKVFWIDWMKESSSSLRNNFWHWCTFAFAYILIPHRSFTFSSSLFKSIFILLAFC